MFRRRSRPEAGRSFSPKEGQQFFRDLAVGRARSEIMIRRNDGAAFGAGHQKRRMGIACERAGIERITFHGLRHTYASQLAMAGVPQAYIRDALGHRTLAMSDRAYENLPHARSVAHQINLLPPSIRTPNAIQPHIPADIMPKPKASTGMIIAR